MTQKHLFQLLLLAAGIQLAVLHGAHSRFIRLFSPRTDPAARCEITTVPPGSPVDRRPPTGRPFAPAPLQSLPHYYERLRPCAPPWYSCRGCLLDRLPSHRSDRFSRSVWKPGSRPLHAGRRLGHHRAPPTLSQERDPL